ncbi:ATP-binding cassette domain-containing protein [Paucilactobacillus nenjiangensis]|uniref:ATP-binding cassette domain-containing protein n=1 Tax=Paucilactobacillus nenjiangensis TaxID=1296540 RepID=A0A5P1WZR8_9LACO|nr:ATP-binding cassette domain-containing protein [Paucilactobacillus nenjiangensis]QER66743.1 ATP-binding cassette domain-containing protein [Paucilactobacillus nenjiangensis]
MTKIQISKLFKNEKKQVLLEDFSRQFLPATVSALAGTDFNSANSLFELIAGQAKLDDGSILIDGQDSYKARKKLADQIGYVDGNDKNSLRGTVDEVISSTVKKNNGGISKDQVAAILKQLDIHLIEPADGLEAGRLQQLKIIVEIAKGKSILLLANPTAEMNELQRTQIWQLLRDFAKKTQAIIIFSSDSISEMQYFADEILYIDNGKLRHVQKLITHDTTDCLVTVKGTGFPVAMAETLGSFVIREANDEIRFIFSGNIQALLPLLEQSTITDIRISDVTVKDELMRF